VRLFESLTSEDPCCAWEAPLETGNADLFGDGCKHISFFLCDYRRILRGNTAGAPSWSWLVKAGSYLPPPDLGLRGRIFAPFGAGRKMVVRPFSGSPPLPCLPDKDIFFPSLWVVVSLFFWVLFVFPGRGLIDGNHNTNLPYHFQSAGECVCRLPAMTIFSPAPGFSQAIALRLPEVGFPFSRLTRQLFCAPQISKSPVFLPKLSPVFLDLGVILTSESSTAAQFLVPLSKGLENHVFYRACRI